MKNELTIARWHVERARDIVWRQEAARRPPKPSSTSDAEIVELARSIDDVARSIVESAEESREGIKVFGRFLKWDEIRNPPSP